MKMRNHRSVRDVQRQHLRRRFESPSEEPWSYEDLDKPNALGVFILTAAVCAVVYAVLALFVWELLT